MNYMNSYYNKLHDMMNSVIEKDKERITMAAEWMSSCIDKGNHIYFFGTGHSYIVGQEVFARAGGYAGFTPILCDELGMNHAFKSTLIERTTEYASVIMGMYHFHKGDMIIMSSNSGRNKLIIELAIQLKAMGVGIIALTALDESRKATSRHSSGLRLFEIADIVLDNHSVFGDACIEHNDTIMTGPTSTIMNCYVIQLLVTEFVQMEINKGKDVPVFISSNTDAGDKHNERLFQLCE